MKTLYLDCTAGVAGDMLTAALLELHGSSEEFIERLNGIGIPNTEIRGEAVTKCGIRGTGMRVIIFGHEEGVHEHSHEHAHEHGHEHAHEYDHHHVGMDDIRAIINGLSVSEKVKSDALSVYEIIAKAESAAHGQPVSMIHFHEVGMTDAVADIVGACMLIEELKPDKIVASRVRTGYGSVKCAHGILPVPAPATADILRGIPAFAGEIEGEFCTPTGAALVKYFADEFTDAVDVTAEQIGYGMGKRSFYDDDGNEFFSAVRAVISEESGCSSAVILSCNIDDMTGEQAGFAVERLIEAGALDVFTAPIYMKKNRPGILLAVMCESGEKKHFAELIFKYTTTIGIRELPVSRYVLDREEKIVNTNYGDVRAKLSSGYGVFKLKAEYEDLRKKAIENDISVGDIKIK